MKHQEIKRITLIEKPSSYSKQYRIYINDEFVFSVHEDVFVKCRLYKGMEVDEGRLAEWLREEEIHQVKLAAYRYLSYRPRTVYEVHTYLKRKGFADSLIEPVLNDLKEQRYLDDRAFAKSWVDERRRLKGIGTLRLKQELAKKGIASSLIDEALSYVDLDEQRQMAMKVAERRYLRICGESWPVIERRLGQYLLRQGFPYETVFSVLQEFRARHDEEKGST